MDELTLTEAQEAELRRLLGFYRRESDRCKDARAFLAGCVMAGAELETALLLMVSGYPEDVIASSKLPRKNSQIKPVLDWNLSELLIVAKATGWLPAALAYGNDEWDHKRAKIGDHAEILREMRNLAHPARYIEDHFGKRVTKKHLEMVFDTINAVSSWLYARIERSLLERMKAEGWQPEKNRSTAHTRRSSRSRRPR